MKRRRGAALGAGALALSAVPVWAAAHWLGEIRFGPAEGAQASKTVETELELAVEHFVVRTPDQELAIEVDGRDPAEFEAAASWRIAVLDAYGASEGGRPLALTRGYEDLSASYEPNIGEDGELDSPELMGARVLFEWDGDEEVYAKRTAEDSAELDAEWFALLDEDLDLRVLLPRGEVEAGAEWEVDWSAMRSVLFPGIRPAALTGEGWPFEGVPEELLEEIADAIDGETVELTYAGSEEGIATIQLASELDAYLDLEFLFDEEGFRQILLNTEPQLGEATLELELEGELLWDEAAGRFSSFELTGEGTLDVAIDADWPLGEQSIPIELEAELSVELELGAEAD